MGRIAPLTFRRSLHVSSSLKQAMGIDGNTILAESLKKQVKYYHIFFVYLLLKKEFFIMCFDNFRESNMSLA